MSGPRQWPLLAMLTAAGIIPAGDWPQFRGPGMTGVSAETGLPDHWSLTENLRWKVVLPRRGVSSPVVIGERVFVTSCSGLNDSRLHLFCLDAANGAKCWERQFWATGPTNCNPKTSPAASTPAIDADRVFALFATGDLVCLDHDGDLLWLRTLQSDYPAMTNFVGRAASPILSDGLLIVPMESQGASFLLGLDAATGRNRWRIERPAENSYTTPLLMNHGGRCELVVQAQSGLTGYDPSTGLRRWDVPLETASAVASPVAAGDVILSPGREMVALGWRAGAAPEVLWQSARLSCGTPTPLAADGRIYSLKDAGTIVCGNLHTGKEVWTRRLHGAYSASPILADRKLYLVNEDGQTTVVRIGDDPSVVAVNSLAGPMLATPAIAGGRIFLRSDTTLYCVGR